MPMPSVRSLAIQARSNHADVARTPAVKAIVTGIFSSFAILSTNAQAACANKDCACTPDTIQFSSVDATPNEQGKFPIALEADDMLANGQESITLNGNALVSQGRQTIVADTATYYRDSERVTASGNVEIIAQDGTYISASSIDVHAPSQVGQVNETKFKLAQSMTSKDGVDTVSISGRGSADQANLEGEGLLRLKGATYTNCVEGKDDVIIKARELELDRAAGIGVAKGATVRFKGVPIFYMPWVSFPLNDERKTGFLTPGFGSDQESGNILEIPWYWNIAPNQDATITPRWYTDRGVQLGVEYRHMSASSTSTVYYEALPSDDLFGDDRDMFSLQHQQQFGDKWSGLINYNDVSDAEYFDDFRNDVRYFSAAYVPRDARLSYRGDVIRNATLFFSEYQIVDSAIPESSKPYERRPSFTLSSRTFETAGFRYGVDASYTDFASDFRIEGTRTALSPYLERPFEAIWGYAKPKLTLHSRSYSLDNVEAGNDDSPSFTTPIFSLDTGIYFERVMNWFGESSLQTLEPRLLYVYSPEESDENDVPFFDTGAVGLNDLNSIFRINRFNGSDRVGDTNRVTVGVTTRISDNETGTERFRASVGQLVLLEDQVINTTADTVVESGLGDFLAEMRSESKGGWRTSAFVQYNHEDSFLRQGRASFGYRPPSDNRKRVDLSYYYSKATADAETENEQLTLSGEWPISDRFQAFAYERYSLSESESLETTLGVEYNACCWKLRFTAQDRITNSSIDEKKTSYFVELELTSLGRIRTGIR